MPNQKRPGARVQRAPRLVETAFAPIPHRAIGDQRLSAIHFRVLAAIAYHDRLSSPRGQGQGCWAGNDTLARLCKCHLSTLSTAITELAAWEYISREPHPINRRLRIFRVLYESEIVCQQANDDALPSDKLSPSVEATICLHKGESPEGAQESGVEYIPRKREDILPKQERHSVETASLRSGLGCEERDTNAGHQLAEIERLFWAGKIKDWPIVIEKIDAIIEEFSDNQKLSNWGKRLLEAMERK